MNFDEKCNKIKEFFSLATTPEERYQCLIDLGRQQPVMPEVDRIDRIVGCQSLTYIRVRLQDGLFFCDIFSDARISAGLGQLLTRVYSGETPEFIISHPPEYVREIGLKLSPGRANGLLSMWQRIYHEAMIRCSR